MDSNTETSPIPSIEGEAKKELSPHERVSQALKDGLSIFELIPDDKVTLAQKVEREAIKKRVEDLDNGGDGTELVELKDEKGRIIKTQKEGIPVYELITNLEDQHKLALASKDINRAKELRKILRNLTPKKYTRDYYDLAYRWVPRYYLARYSEEIQRMEKDGRGTGDAAQDFIIARLAVDTRRELFVPPPVIPPPTPPIPPPIPPPLPPEESTEIFSIAYVDASDDAKKISREVGGEYVREQLNIKNKLNPLEWIRAIKFRWGEQYYKYQKAQEAQREQVRTGHYFVKVDAISGALSQVNGEREQLTATAKRFAEGEHGIHRGEETQKSENAEINKQITDLITKYAKGEITREQLTTENQVIITALKANPDTAQYIKDAAFIADNLSDVAERVKSSYERGTLGGLDTLDRKLNIQLGRALMASQTEADYTRMEKTINWLQGGKYRSLLANPLFIGIAFGAAGVGARSILGWGAKAATAFPLAGAAIGGLFTGLRRWTDLKRDLELAERDKTYSNFQPDKRPNQKKEAPRLAKLAEFGLNRKADGGQYSYAEMTDELNKLSNDDLSTDQGIDAVIKKIAEIEARINYGNTHKKDMLAFSGRYTTEIEAYNTSHAQNEAEIKIRAALKARGMSDDQVNSELSHRYPDATNIFLDQYEAINKHQAAEFNKFRRTESAKAALWGVLGGLGGALLSQEAWAGIQRGVFHQEAGSTILENVLSGKPVAEWLGGGRAAGFAVDQAKELYDHPGNLPINKDLILRTNFGHGASFTDAVGNQLPGPPLHETIDGHLVASGNLNNLPNKVQQLFKSDGWQSNPYASPDLNLHAKIQEYIGTGGHETFIHGNTIIDLDATNHTFSIQDFPSKETINGVINPLDNSMTVEKIGPAMLNRFKEEGWDIKTISVPSPAPVGTTIDQLLGQDPNVLRAQGIIETDGFKKTWDWHVLKPDIVDATGNHTHNELTMHLGGTVKVASGEVRTGIGLPGQINAGAEIHGGLIQAHLPGVPAAEDPVLNSLITSANGLNKSDMVAVVNLTDGRQIMLPFDQMGNAQLPAEFHTATGDLIGVKSIATAVLEKPDHTILTAGELAASGQMPNGTIVHSLASEQFLGIAPPPALPAPPHEIFNIIPPEAVEYIPPLPQELELPPLIPLPFAPRHPLESTMIPDNHQKTSTSNQEPTPEGNTTSSREPTLTTQRERETTERTEAMVPKMPSSTPVQPNTPGPNIPPVVETVPETTTLNQELEDTENWAKEYSSGYVALYNKTDAEKRRILSTFRDRAGEQERLINEHYQNRLAQLDNIGQENVYWEKQTNPSNMLSCQFASLINTLRSLGVYNPTRHTQENVLRILGGDSYAATHRTGVGSHDLDDVFNQLAPEVSFRRSNSVYEILRAVETGAAAIIELGPNHIGIIPPGHRITRGPDNRLLVQVIDPLSGPRLMPVERLIKSNITLTGIPQGSPGIIVEARPANIPTVERKEPMRQQDF